MTPKSRKRKVSKDRRRRSDQRDPAWTTHIWDLHLPVMSVKAAEEGGVETKKPVVYGTAFPIGDGFFITARHVVRDADADGEPVLSVMSGPGTNIKPYRINDFELVDSIDIAVLRCKALEHLPKMHLEFDTPLGLLAPVSAIGFPLALDAEFVRVTPRAFGGVVVSRRRLFHLAGQPPGYEVSFFAPQGLSGAPLVSVAHGRPRCYGVMIQQGTLGQGSEITPVGLAVGVDALLSVTNKHGREPLAKVFGREFVPPRPTETSPRTHIEALDKGWPDEDLENREGAN